MNIFYKINKENLIKEICNIINNSFNILIKENENIFNKNLFDDDIGFTSIEMIYLIKILEAKYGIYFNEIDYDDTRIYTINGISEIIYNKINI